jgi:hypothetical protein
MKTQRFSSARAVVAPLVLALAFASDEVSFHPKSGSELSKKLKVELELELKSMSVKEDGESVPAEDLPLGDESKAAIEMSIGVTDKYVDTKDGKPLDLLRTFDALALDARLGDEKKSVEEFKAIEGKTVRFKWNDDSKAYDKSFHESKGDDEELASLSEDMDLRVLLPDKKVSSGDTWDVAAERLLPLFVPGGLAVHAGKGEGAEQFKAIADGIREKALPSLKDFKVHCKYKGAHEDGGVKVSEIQLTFDDKASLDVSDIVARLSELEDSAGPKPDVTMSIRVGLKGEGVLLWDQAAGHVHSFEMQADIDADVEGRIRVEMEGEHSEIAMTASVGGHGRWELAPSK